MSNNLRQIAKDLRSFVKRCKDVHYSDSLLITFLVTGLLTLAPKTLSADVVEEQQEISASAYDTITDLRQSFIRARQENEKSIKGAERELILLMEQGDQVIKSPWASFQFATGFTNNDWRTSYRGRGGKYLEYYNRTNDLTKYVFDASKHEYGATNLHVQRNQEPNSLTINPANIHEPYKPYEAYKIDNINMPKDVSFNPNVPTSATWVKPANYVQNGTSTSYTLNNANPNINRASYWGDSATFDLANGRYRAYDGMYEVSVNTYNQTTSGTDFKGTAANRAIMNNGTNNHWQTNYKVNGTNQWYNWYHPTVSWGSSVQYYNLNTSGISPTTTSPDFYTTAPNNDGTPQWSNAGYDAIYGTQRGWRWGYNSNVIGGGYYNGTYGGDWSSFITNAVNISDNNKSVQFVDASYDTLHGPAANVSAPIGTSPHSGATTATKTTAWSSIPAQVSSTGGGSPTYYYATTGSRRGTAGVGSYKTITLPNGTTYNYSNDENGARQYTLDVLTIAATDIYNARLGSWQNDWNQFALNRTRTDANGNVITGGYRDELIRTNKPGTFEYIDVNIAQNNVGGVFAKILDVGDITVNDVDVSIYNGSGGAYVMSPGRAGTSKVKFDDKSSIANFDTRNGIIDSGGLTGTSNNVAFNIQDGNATEADGVGNTVEITGGVDVRFRGTNNHVFNVRSAVDTLKIAIGEGQSGASPITAGQDKLKQWNTQTGGRIFTAGNDNVVYNGYGSVTNKNSVLYLADVQMQGNNTIMVNLQSGDHGQTAATGKGGLFNGKIGLQGAFGGTHDATNAVAVYAASGQNKEALDAGSFVAGMGGKAIENVRVDILNVGFHKNASNGVSVLAKNGSSVEVGAGQSAFGNITEGIHAASTIDRGYDKIKLADVGSNHIIGYAAGETSDIKAHLIQGKFVNKASKIDFKENVDVMSKDGRAFVAVDGGEIELTSGKNVRAAGSGSVIAYADGYQPGLNGKNSDFNSKVTIKGGDVVAADWLTLGDDGTTNNYNINDSAANARTYNNIGAYAINGGEIDITGTKVSTSVQEKSTATANSEGSIIYGVGAIAKNNASVKMKNVTIVDNEYGALYGENNGRIEFEGNIVNQNYNNPSGKITPDTTNAKVKTDTRHAKSTSTANSHANVSPFYAKRINTADQSSITFTGGTEVDMYDGILLTGNIYNGNGNAGATRIETGDSQNREFDYAKEATQPTNEPDLTIWNNAKYRGMKNVTANILSDNVTIGVVNQAADEIKWDTDKSGKSGTGVATGNFLSGVGAYAGGMKILNKGDKIVDVSLINSRLKIDGQNVNIEDIETSKATAAPTTDKNDVFNDLKMESTFVTINNATVSGDAQERDLKDAKGNSNYQVRNVGLSMANSLSRWDDVKSASSAWRKTNKNESGFQNIGKVDIWGGSDATPVTGLLANFGTIKNGDGSKGGFVNVDHGNAIVATDGSIIHNLKNSEITVTGKYKKPTSNPPTQGRNANRSDDSKISGENYGIVGISDGFVDYNYSDLNNHSGVDNSIEIKHEDGKIYVEGDLAVGIYGENRNNADSSKVTIDFVNATVGATGIDVRNKGVTSPDARGVGIALVNKSNNNYSNGWQYAGGVINLKGGTGVLGTAGFAQDATLGGIGSLTLDLKGNDIATGKNGVGIYAESAVINVNSDKFTVETKDNGVGLWAMDDSIVGEGANHTKTFQYNYNGANDKNGFAMAFGGKNIQATTAQNDLDIKFSNVSDTAVTLANEIAKSTTGTTKGIAGILVNTNDANDKVINKGDIKEDTTSVTNVRTYGAVVNKGNFVNYGAITLNDSLNHQANLVTSEDMKKVNIGIFANGYNADKATGGVYTTIENHGDIKIESATTDIDKNIGSWAIYGYNVKTGAKEDGTKSEITINKNSHGIYSGDGNVEIRSTKLKVGNDTVLGHKQVLTGEGILKNPSAYPISRQTTYATDQQLLGGLDTPRERDSAVGVYIDNNQRLTNAQRNVEVSADMDIDRYSYGIVLAEKNGGAQTDVTIGSALDAPTIRLAYSTNNNAGGHVKSTKPSNPKVPEEVYEQGNAVYYYSADTESRGKSYANVTMDGDYNTAYYTKGSMDNYGTIDLRSQYDLENQNNNTLGFGNVGIFSSNTAVASKNYGTITTGMSDTVNMRYSAAMAAGRNIYRDDNGTAVFDRTQEEGNIENHGTIVVKEKEGIGMFATGAGSVAKNYGTIRLEGDSSIGMYLDRGAIGENHGEITGNASQLKGVVAINGGYIKNYGKINILGQGSYGIVTDGSRFIVDANGNPTEVLTTGDPRYNTSAAVTTGNTNGHGGTDLYGGSESSIEEGTTGNPKTTGVGTTITAPDIVPITKVTVDGIDTPIFNVESDATNPGDWGEHVFVSSSVQSGGTTIIPLWAKDEYGNPAFPAYHNQQMSEVTSIGMYVDTSGVRYTNPIDGIQNLPNLGKVDLYFGPEATQYTNSKAIRIGDRYDEDGNLLAKSNILKPFNDALRRLPGGARVNPLSASLTWQVLAKIDDNNELTEIYMSKVPYHSFAFDDDHSLVNFTNNLDNIYEIARPGSEEKMIFNKLNSLGNGEGHILAQAFDQMRGHIYGGIQQRTKSTSDILSNEVAQLRSETNGSKDSNKFKAFGQRNEYKTDTAGIPDWRSNAGGMVYVHEDETVKLGEKSGFYAGVTNNYFTFKDLARSYENQAMAKAGIFKQTPLDENGTFTITVGGEGFFGRTDTKRRFWVVDKEFRAKSNYYTYGAGLNANLEKVFRINQGFSIVPNVGLNFEYGRFSTVNEDGDMALKVKSDDYYSIKPKAGIDFRYSQPVFKNSKFTASLGFSYENELGRINEVENEARIKGAWTDYYTIKGDKEDRRGNFKSDLKLGLDNGRLGMTVNTGYDTKGHNFRAGLGLKVMY